MSAYRPVNKKDRFPYNGRHICARVRAALKAAGLNAPFRFDRHGDEGSSCLVVFDETYSDASRAMEICVAQVGPWFNALACRMSIGATRPVCSVGGTVFAGRVAYKSLSFATGF